VKAAAAGGEHQGCLGEPEPRYERIDVKSVRVERVRDFGGPWLGLELARRLGLVEFLNRAMQRGREEVPWPLMSLVLVLCRLCDPSSELHIAEHFYEHSAMGELLGVPAEKVNEDRLYRALDEILPHKAELEKHLKARLGELFGLEYDLLLYDVTSTYFEGQAEANEQAKRGHSRDQRSDCKQVCIALVVSRCGMPLGYEVFAGNRSDVTTVQEIVELMEGRYGKADRIWAMDRGMVSQKNVKFLQEGGRRYILGTPRSMLKKYQRQLLEGGWSKVHQGLEVKLAPSSDGKEVFILCHSDARQEKEKAMHQKFADRIEAALTKMAAGCLKRPQSPVKVAQSLGKLLGRNTRAAGGFKVDVQTNEQGQARVVWTRNPAWKDWVDLSDGSYLLRSNILNWSPEDLWKAYMQLTEAEGAFRISKSDLEIRPIWHQNKERVNAHILVCFLAYVLWKMLARWCHQAGLGDEPRKVLEELGRIRLVDVVMRTQRGVELRRRCVSRPDDHQAILLHRLRLNLPQAIPLTGDWQGDVVET
jgi:transposase